MTEPLKRARGTSNSLSRGSAQARRARRRWLLLEFGDGLTAQCQLRVSENCLGTVDMETLSIDRYPIPGVLGGRYVRGNIRPACTPCNSADGGRLGAGRLAEAKAQAAKQTRKTPKTTTMNRSKRDDTE